jgi:UrcA family protein
MFTTARNRLIALTLTAAAGAAFLTVPTHAQPADAGIQSIVVRYGDLDLATDAGVKALYSRLQVAAGKVCRSLYSEGGPRRQACYEQSLSRAVTHVNLAMLSVLHQNASARPRVS